MHYVYTYNYINKYVYIYIYIPKMFCVVRVNVRNLRIYKQLVKSAALALLLIISVYKFRLVTK